MKVAQKTDLQIPSNTNTTGPISVFHKMGFLPELFQGCIKAL